MKKQVVAITEYNFEREGEIVARQWRHLKYQPERNASHSRESGNPVREERISQGLRSGFPLSRE